MASLVATLLSINIVKSVDITGWVYADNWFELYFNGVKVAEDPVYFYPHNAVYVSFTAPDDGLYSFAFWAQDFANTSTGLEPRQNTAGEFAGWCVGDGGIRMKLSDGTVTNGDWKCMVVHEGPNESACQGGECIDRNMRPSECTATENSYPSCWYQTECAAADSWTSATEYTQDVMGWGRSPNSQPETYGYTYPEVCSGLDATSTTEIYEDEGCLPHDKFNTDTTSTPIWTSDIDYHNRIICRYSYCVGGGTDCTASGGATSSPTDDTSSPSLMPSSPPTLPTEQTPSPSSMPTTSPVEGGSDPKDNSGANQVFGFMALVIITFIVMMI